MTRVLVTRPAGQAAPLAEALSRAGFEPVVVPLIEIVPIDDGPIDVDAYDWVIVTSTNGADQLAARIVGRARIAAIGHTTADALRVHGLPVDFVPTRADQETLVAEFPRPVGRALFVGAEDARGVIATELPADVRTVYRTRRVVPGSVPEADLAVIASPSAARALEAVTTAIPAVSIGPITTDAARAARLDIAAEAKTQDLPGIVAAVREAAG